MKKMCLILLTLLLSVCLLGFKEPLNKETNNVSYTVDSKYLTIYAKENKYSFDISDAKIYSLYDKSNNYLGNRILIFNYDYILKIANMTSFDKNYLFAYINNTNITFYKEIINKEQIRINELATKNKIYEGTPKFDEYNNIFIDYLTINRNNNPNVSTFGYDYAESNELNKITSSDEYLDGYSVQEFTYDALKTDDDIVKIIPKDWFFRSGIHSYVGKEYIIYVNTFFYEVSTYHCYLSQVTVFDIDVTNSRTTLWDYEEHKNSIENVSISNNNNFYIYIKQAINEFYIGIENYSDYFKERYFVDDSQYRVVLNSRNFDASVQTFLYPMPIYLKINNLTYGVLTDVNKYYLSDMSYYLRDDNNTQVIADENKICEAVTNIGWFSFVEYLNTLSDTTPVGTLVDIGKLIYELFDAIGEEFGTQDIPFDSESNEYAIDLVGTSTVKNVATIKFADFVQAMQENEMKNYEYIIKIGTHCSPTMTPPNQKLLFESNLIITMEAINSNGDKLLFNNDSVFCYTKNEKYDYSYKVNSSDETDVLNSLNNISVNIEDEHIGEILIVCLNRTSNVIFNLPKNVMLTVFSLDGRVVNSNNSMYGIKESMVYFFKANTYYFIEVKYLNADTGLINISNDCAKISGNQIVYERQGSTGCVMTKVLSQIYDIYQIYTNSILDTEIFVFDDEYKLIGHDDDSNADYSEDMPDQNAYLHIGIGNVDKIYIFVLAKYNRGVNSVELRIIL